MTLSDIRYLVEVTHSFFIFLGANEVNNTIIRATTIIVKTHKVDVEIIASDDVS